MQPFLLQSFSQPLLIICWGVPRKYTSSYHPLCEFLSISRHSKLFVGRERERFYSRSLPRCFICFFANYIRKIPTYPHVVISSLTFEVTTTTLQPLRNSFHFSFMCLHHKHQFRSITVSFYN